MKQTVYQTTWLTPILGLGLWLGGVGVPGAVVQAQMTPAASHGYELLNKGWINDAISAFQQALNQAPNSVEVQLGLAIAYQKAGDDTKAWTAYQRVVQLDRQNRTALVALGMLGGYRPEWQTDGIVALTTLLTLEPQNLTARAQRGLLLGYQGRFGEALADYAVVLKANPTPDMVVGAAQINSYSGNFTDALRLFQQYLQSNSKLPDGAITAYAVALRQSGRVTEAIQVLQARWQQCPCSEWLETDLRSALAVAYYTNQQTTEAQALLLPLRDKPQTRLPLARALSAMARQYGDLALYQEAIDLYQQTLQSATSPTTSLLLEAAELFSELPESQSYALALYNQLLQQQPLDRVIQIRQLALAAQLGQVSPVEVSQQLQSWLQPLPTEAGALRSLALALTKLDSPSSALIPTYEAILQTGVDVPFLYFRLAQMQVQAGNLLAAQTALDVYRQSPSGAADPSVELLLAEIDRRQGNITASLGRYEALMGRSLKPETIVAVLQGLAGLYQAQGRLAEAVQLYDQILSRTPNQGRAKLGRASLAYQAKQLSAAEATLVLDDWLQAHPDQTPPELYSLVGALPPDAQREDLYQRLATLNPTDIPVQTRWLQVMAKRDPQQAKARVDQLIQQSPNDLTAYFIQGELAQSLQDWNWASQAYQRILDRQPTNVDALSALGGIQFRQQRFGEAMRIYRQVLTLKPNDRDTRRIIAELLAAQDYPVSALHEFVQLEREEKASGTAQSAMTERILKGQIELLKRRGFQPPWEGY